MLVSAGNLENEQIAEQTEQVAAEISQVVAAGDEVVNYRQNCLWLASRRSRLLSLRVSRRQQNRGRLLHQPQMILSLEKLMT